MVDGVKWSFCIILRLNTLVTEYQATVSVKVICGPTSIDSFTRRSMYPDATELVVITCLNAITCHCWLLMLKQTYVSGVLCTSFLHFFHSVLYILCCTHTRNSIYARDLQILSVLGRPQHLNGVSLGILIIHVN